jgi:hypothetical protein
MLTRRRIKAMPAETNGTNDLDLVITKVTRRAAGGGTWVCGRISEHRFDALVFHEHATNPEREIGDSRISKLWVQRLADKKKVYNWDRGADIPAENETARAIVDFLCAGRPWGLFDLLVRR